MSWSHQWPPWAKWFGSRAPGRAVRLNQGHPVITPAQFSQVEVSPGEGININGPSVIRIPGWLKQSGDLAHPDAVYYMYFASHVGKYIRMAWAKELTGPWQLHGTGRHIEPGSRGVLDLGDDNCMSIGNGLTIRGHVASPDVHVDDVNKRIVMFFHGPVFHHDQRLGQGTLAAVSFNGLNFNPPESGGQPGGGVKPVVLGSGYFRVFEQHGRLYAVAGRGLIYRAPGTGYDDGWQAPGEFDFSRMLWECRGEPLLRTPDNRNSEDHHVRHSAVIRNGDFLDVYYSCIGDVPERILFSRIDISSPNWNRWSVTGTPVAVLSPERAWEGSELPLRPSESGWGIGVRELRDPCIFHDQDKRFLFYCGRGEEGIGLARLEGGG